MGTPNKDVLKANAIANSERSNKLFCSICTLDNFSEDWNDHIKKDSHVDALERFNETFDNRGEKACCKMCKCEVLWDTIKSHGKMHMILPWYEPDDKDKRLYENHTFKFRKYYCFLCDEIFPEWSMTYVHIDNEKHQNIIKKVRQSVTIKQPQKFFRTLIFEGFVPGKGETVVCRFCNKIGLGYHRTVEHIKKPIHKKSRLQFIEKLKTRVKNGDSGEPVVESSEPEEASSTPIEKST